MKRNNRNIRNLVNIVNPTANPHLVIKWVLHRKHPVDPTKIVINNFHIRLTFDALLLYLIIWQQKENPTKKKKIKKLNTV